jgi:hypothetical protein
MVLKLVGNVNEVYECALRQSILIMIINIY